jgi:TonB-linked SusC/RagA family outer membrane protein
MHPPRASAGPPAPRPPTTTAPISGETMNRKPSSWAIAVVLCFLTLLAGPGAAWGQEVAVQGRVTNEQDQPIAGVAVSVEGAPSTTTTTDATGHFSLRVPSSTSTLVITHAGYAPVRAPLNGRTEVAVQLKGSVVQLDQLVVVGYGTQKKSDVTGSVASVSSEDLEDKAVTSVDQALEGRIAGVSITTTGGGAEPSISFQIRGQNSILANTDPLVVVDGIPYDGGLSEINQNDIASINVLKDASAAAIYGSRGANGVILITTKKGTGAPRFSYQGYAGMQHTTNVPRVMTGAEFADFKCTRLGAQGDCDSVLTATELNNLNAGNSTDWLGLATHTGFQQQHNLSVSGGTGGTRYYLAGSLLDVNGVARNDEFDRYSLRLNLDQTIHSWLELGSNTQLSLVDRSGIDADFESAFFMNPLTDAYNDDGSLTIYPWPEDIFWSNPLEGTLATNVDKTHRVFSSNFIQVSAPFLEGLSYRFNGGIDYAQRDIGTYYGRNTQVGFETQGQATRRHSTDFDWTAENVVRFNREFGDHTLDLTGLYSMAHHGLDMDQLRSQGFPNDVLTYYQADVGALLTPSYEVTDSKIISQMARLNYSYADRYLLTLTARRDGYSGFGKNDKYGVFPSLALGWNLSNESFWPQSDAVNMLKLRGSYGQNGNQAVSPYRTLARLNDRSYVDDQDVTQPGYLPQTLGNPVLHWETTTALNLGADFGLFQNRVTGSLDVYRARTNDLLLNRLVSPVEGINSVSENIGEVANKGVELQLSTIDVEGENFRWTTDFNIAANRNEIVDLYGNGQSDVLNQWFIGQPVDVNYGYEFGGIFQSAEQVASSAQPESVPGDVIVVDRNGDGKITPDDRTFLGSLQPSYSAGLVNTFRYKGVSLSAFLNTVQGIRRPNPLLNTNLVHAEVRRNTIYTTFWTPENPINTYPRNNEDANLYSVTFYQDASFIRLKDVTLSYDIPSSLTDRFGVQSLRVYLNGRNLWTHTAWTGLDPEISNSNQRGVPLERVLIGGVNVSF